MAEYQRFLSYLFEYEGDIKKGNCGFARIEVRGGIQRIFLSVRSAEQVELLHVFGFYRVGQRCECVPLGRMIVKGGRGQLQYVNSGPHLSYSQVSFGQLAGLVVGRQQPFGSAYATVWDDEPFGLSMFAPQPPEPLTGEAAAQKKAAEEKADLEEVTTRETASEKAVTGEALAGNAITEAAVPQERGAKAAGGSMEPPEDPRRELQDGELQVMQISGTAVNTAGEASCWERLCRRYPRLEAPPGEAVECLKVMPADIGRLPRPNWMLSSNGFLMYSYVRHRYIVFARVKEDAYELWVPGSHERNEEILAKMFGFYRFRPTGQKTASGGEFGYWCVPLDFGGAAF